MDVKQDPHKNETLKIDNIYQSNDYKICKQKLTLECCGLADKKFFHGSTNICRNCFNYKQFINRREKEGRIFVIDSK